MRRALHCRPCLRCQSPLLCWSAWGCSTTARRATPTRKRGDWGPRCGTRWRQRCSHRRRVQQPGWMVSVRAWGRGLVGWLVGGWVGASGRAGARKPWLAADTLVSPALQVAVAQTWMARHPRTHAVWASLSASTWSCTTPCSSSSPSRTFGWPAPSSNRRLWLMAARRHQASGRTRRASHCARTSTSFATSARYLCGRGS